MNKSKRKFKLTYQQCRSAVCLCSNNSLFFYFFLPSVEIAFITGKCSQHYFELNAVPLCFFLKNFTKTSSYFSYTFFCSLEVWILLQWTLSLRVVSHCIVYPDKCCYYMYVNKRNSVMINAYMQVPIVVGTNEIQGKIKFCLLPVTLLIH